MQIDALNMVFVIAAFVGILLSVLLLSSSNRTHSGNILGAFIVCMTLFSIHNIMLQSGMIREFPRLFRFSKPLQYAIPFLVYLYIRGQVYNELRFRKRDWIFFIPMILHAFELLPFYFMQVGEKKKVVEHFYADMNSGLTHTEGFLPPFVHPFLILGFGVVMYSLSAKLLVRATKDSLRFQDVQNRQQLKWLFFFLAVNVAILCILIFHNLTFNRFQVNTFRLNNVEGALMLICIGVALFFSPGILYGFRGAPLLVELIPVNKKPELKDHKNADADGKEARAFVLTDSRRKEYIHKIAVHFEANQPYVRQGYTVKMLAEELHIPYSYLSQVINQEYGMNFNEFINSYRVSYVKELLTRPDAHQYTFEALSSQAGFSSRATFSRAFSRFTGCTPSEFVKNAAH